MRAARRDRLALLFLLPVAIWSAYPRFQWCEMSWAEVQPECLVSCAVQSSLDACPASVAPECRLAGETCCSGEPDVGETAVDRGIAPITSADAGVLDAGAIEVDPDETKGRAEPSSRAWCLGDAGGPALRERDPPSPFADLFNAIAGDEELVEPRLVAIGLCLGDDARPPTEPAHARPPVRGPPLT